MVTEIIYWYVPGTPEVVKFDAIELTDPLLIETDDCWEKLSADVGRCSICC